MNQAASNTKAATGMTPAMIDTQRRAFARSSHRCASSSNAIAASDRTPTGGKRNISRFQAGAAAPSDMELSLLRDAGVTDHAAPFVDFSPQSAGKLVRRGRQRLEAQFRVALHQFGV